MVGASSLTNTVTTLATYFSTQNVPCAKNSCYRYKLLVPEVKLLYPNVVKTAGNFAVLQLLILTPVALVD